MNKRVIIGAVIGVTFFLFAHRPASAMVEFCPAHLKYQAVTAQASPAPQQPAPNASLYGFVLQGHASRTLASARLAFDTSAGWYTVDLADVTLAPKDRHYYGTWQSFVVHDHVSPVMYVRFPRDVHIAHAWVYSATPANGPSVTCPPPPGPSRTQLDNMKKFASNRRRGPVLDAKDDDHLSAAPSTSSQVIGASASQALEAADCAEPFQYAEVQNQAMPHFPDSAKGFVSSPVTSTVTVVINGDGTLAGSELWATSGYKPLDDEAVRAAHLSTYSGARSYCQAVPSYYFFKVTFDPYS